MYLLVIAHVHQSDTVKPQKQNWTNSGEGHRNSKHIVTMPNPTNSNESYCTFTLAGDVTTGGLPGEAQIRTQLEDNDPQVSDVRTQCIRDRNQALRKCNYLNICYFVLLISIKH